MPRTTNHNLNTGSSSNNSTNNNNSNNQQQQQPTTSIMKRVALAQDIDISPTPLAPSFSESFSSAKIPVSQEGFGFGLDNAGAGPTPACLWKPQPPKIDYTPKSDALMAKEISQLSLRERTAIQEEIHGVHEGVEETPELLEELLRAFQAELDMVRKKPAYDRTLCLNPRYVLDRERRILFLRADRLNPALAARRYIKYFECKLDVWGMTKLGKEINWEDLEEADKEAVKSGSVWFTKDFDRAGRRLVWIRMTDANLSAVSQVRHTILFALPKACISSCSDPAASLSPILGAKHLVSNDEISARRNGPKERICQD